MAAGSDTDLLEDLLALEARLASAYEAALRRDAIAPAEGELLLAHEREHASALERALGGGADREPRASVPDAELTAALAGPEEFARYVLRLEAEAVTAYAEAAASIRDARLRQPLGSIMACEAAHRVALLDSLGERPPLD